MGRRPNPSRATAMTVNQDLGYLTPAEGDAFDRLIATFPDAEAREFEPWSGTNPARNPSSPRQTKFSRMTLRGFDTSQRMFESS